MKFQVVSTKAGWAVQNTSTYVIVGLFDSKAKAEQVAANLNK
jgi:hypothetical protein